MGAREAACYRKGVDWVLHACVASVGTNYKLPYFLIDTKMSNLIDKDFLMYIYK